MHTKILASMGLALASALLTPDLRGQQRDAANVGIAGPAAALLSDSVAEVTSSFWVYLDIDSGYNHGIPSGFFGTAIEKMSLNAGCVYDATASTGCATNPSRIDRERGTVMCYSFQPMTGVEFGGVSTVEPDGLFSGVTGSSYDLRGVTRLTFDAISLSPNLLVQFGFGGAVSGFRTVPNSWTRITVDASSLNPRPELAATDILFTIVTNAANASGGGRVCVDNIRFEPVPTTRALALGLPPSFQTFGAIPVANDLPGRVPIPPDQLLRNQGVVESSALAASVLLRGGGVRDLQSARKILDTLSYALGNPNAALPLPGSSSSRGLPTCISSGDVALNNPSGAARKGNVRPCGFSAGLNFRVLLDGAGAGSNATAGLAFLRGYLILKDEKYLTAATAIGNWINDNLRDDAADGFGGYVAGFQNGVTGGSRTKILAKQFADNSAIFAFFSLLAETSRAARNEAEAAEWDRRAAFAGDFAFAMVATNGRVSAGTVPRSQPTDLTIGVKADGQVRGNDIVNTFTAARNYALAPLALAWSPRYREQRDWSLVARALLQQTKRVSASGRDWDGIHPATGQPSTPDGISWDATALATLALQATSAQYPESSAEFRDRASAFLTQLRQAQETLGGGRGIVSATIQGEENLPPYEQCLTTPFGCLPSRMSVSATALAFAADLAFNPFSPPPIVTEGGVVNAASSSNTSFSSNTIITVYGSFLASGIKSAALVDGKLPGVVDGTAVLINNVCAPLFFVSAGQINALLPVGLAESGTINLVVTTGAVDNDCKTGNSSTVAPIRLAKVTPGLFTVQAGQGPIAALRGEDNVVITRDTPARAGGVVVAFGTGCGPVSSQIQTGVPVSGLVRVSSPVEAIIGNERIAGQRIQFAGLTPGGAGLCQFNIETPSGLSGSYPIQVVINGVSTQSGATIEIR